MGAYDRAFEIITARRAKAVSEQEQHLQQAGQQIPQIYTIQYQLHNCSKGIIKLIGSNQDQKKVDAEVAKVKTKSQELRARLKQVLRDAGYPADYLDTHFTCPKCKDTGYTGTAYCDCVKHLVGQIQAQELSSHSQLRLSSFDTFSLDYYSGRNRAIMAQIFDYARWYADTFSSNSENVLFYGNSGVGKTHLSLAIANTVLHSGYSVVYDSVISILRQIEAEHFSSGHTYDVLDGYMNTDLLIIDDLGTETNTPFYMMTIYDIVNTRMNAGRPTIISTNLTQQGIQQRYGTRVASRLAGGYRAWMFSGDDVRLAIRLRQNGGEKQ